MCKDQKIEVQVADVEMGDDEDKFVTLPSSWAICNTCRGNGKHSLAIGAITGEEWHNDWSPDEQDDYLAGVYDQGCENCGATGKVLVIDRDACERKPEWAAALAKHDKDEQDRWEDDAMHRAELAMGC